MDKRGLQDKLDKGFEESIMRVLLESIKGSESHSSTRLKQTV